MTLAVLDMWVRENIRDETPYYVQPALRPCPLCGDRVWYRHGGSSTFRDRYHEIICIRCGLSLSAFSRDAAIAKWNLRSPKAADAPIKQPKAERDQLKAAYDEWEYRRMLYDMYRDYRIVNWAMRQGIVPIEGAHLWEPEPCGEFNFVKIDGDGEAEE